MKCQCHRLHKLANNKLDTVAFFDHASHFCGLKSAMTSLVQVLPMPAVPKNSSILLVATYLKVAMFHGSYFEDWSRRDSTCTYDYKQNL